MYKEEYKEIENMLIKRERAYATHTAMESLKLVLDEKEKEKIKELSKYVFELYEDVSKKTINLETKELISKESLLEKAPTTSKEKEYER